MTAPFPSKAVYNPEAYCPVCGEGWGAATHHCSDRTLAGIDGANTKAENQAATPADPARFFGTRLSDGFSAMRDDE